MAGRVLLSKVQLLQSCAQTSRVSRGASCCCQSEVVEWCGSSSVRGSMPRWATSISPGTASRGRVGDSHLSASMTRETQRTRLTPWTGLSWTAGNCVSRWPDTRGHQTPSEEAVAPVTAEPAATDVAGAPGGDAALVRAPVPDQAVRVPVPAPGPSRVPGVKPHHVPVPRPLVPAPPRVPVPAHAPGPDLLRQPRPGRWVVLGLGPVLAHLRGLHSALPRAPVPIPARPFPPSSPAPSRSRGLPSLTLPKYRPPLRVRSALHLPSPLPLRRGTMSCGQHLHLRNQCHRRRSEKRDPSCNTSVPPGRCETGV